MRQIIPFKKELPFKTKVSDITSISLERDISVSDDGIVSGVFHITGDYKMNEGSINRENFAFDLPFDITLDPRYDISTVKTDIEDFYYDVINEDTLKVSIDLFVEAEYLPISEVKNEDLEEGKDDTLDRDTEVSEIEIKSPIIEEKKEKEMIINEKEEDIKEDNVITLENEKEVVREDISDFVPDLFSNLDSEETYATYYVYIVKEEDTIDKILTKYNITKEDFECYNDITDIKPGDKVIIPKTSE